MRSGVKAYLFSAVMLALLSAYGCRKSSDSAMLSAKANVYIALRTSINQDNVSYEDRVDELRMITFELSTGEVVFNEKLYFPNGMSNNSRSVQLTPGTYDFCFIANEDSYPNDFVDGLLEITNKSDLSDDIRFKILEYDPNFTPDAASSSGRFPMSAIYDAVDVVAGGTESSPVMLPLPRSGKVELIRPMAKVEVVFRKKVSGSTLPDDPIGTVRIDNVASYLSVPPLDDYYNGQFVSTNQGSLAGFDYNSDSIGAVTFYIPELLLSENSDMSTLLNIGNKTFPIVTNDIATGMEIQRRTPPTLSNSSIVRNYQYIINANIDTDGELRLEVHFQPWEKERYTYIFEGDRQFVLPPTQITDTSVVITTECGMVEIHKNHETFDDGLMEAYNGTIDWVNSTSAQGAAPYYCDATYGQGWRLINGCEVMSYLAIVDGVYKVWISYTWNMDNVIVPYPIDMRKRAQVFLESFTGLDLSGSVYVDETQFPHQRDQLAYENLGIMWEYFTPGDILLKKQDFPGGWPYSAQPEGPDWMYNESVFQAMPPWAAGYLSPSDRNNWDAILYGNFKMFDFKASTRCARTVE